MQYNVYCAFPIFTVQSKHLNFGFSKIYSNIKLLKHQVFIYFASFMVDIFTCSSYVETPGLTKPGEVGEVLALYQLKSSSLDSKA